LANKVMLSGMLLAAKGDRAMHNALDRGTVPFLDEDVSRSAPDWSRVTRFALQPRNGCCGQVAAKDSA